MVADDSACTGDQVADGCGAFKPVFCSGAEDQEAPGCPLTCTDAENCQGTRTDAVCDNFVCGSEEVDDDSGCGPYKSVYCNGKIDQLAPSCPTICTFDHQCDPNADCIDNVCE